MNIYLLKDGQPIGPFTSAELQEKIYSGEVLRNAMACVEGSSNWVSLETLLTPAAGAATAPPPPVIPFDTNRLRDPHERTALVWLYLASLPVWIGIILVVGFSYGIFLIYFLLYWLFVAFGQAWFAAHLKTNSIRVSATQLPEVYAIVKNSCQRLGMAEPEVYVIQHNVWNSFATRIFKQRMVVLFSGAVDSILLKGDKQQLAWLVGHELGHHWAGHLDKKQKLAKLGGWLIWVYLWHSRRAELTCDRVGLYCAGSLSASQLALMNATVGAQLASQVNVAEAAAQWTRHSGEFFVKYRTLYATHPHLLARLNHLNSAAKELGLGQ